MKTVILGGTFNPVHIGHLYLAEEVKLSLNYERVIFIPAYIPAHKEPDHSTTAVQRLEMLRCAVFNTDFVVDSCEIQRGGVSYTIDTIDQINENYNVTGKPGLVIGDDLVDGFQKWKEWETLIEKVDLIVAHRSYREEVSCEFAHTYLNNLILPISSSDIRARVEKGLSFRYFVPESVFSYIEENKVYGTAESGAEHSG
ncbi:MAG: nicotinate (nicotinamide) nucleotide adenylyltransferase [Spirochaetaceae bacterium]